MATTEYAGRIFESFVCRWRCAWGLHLPRKTLLILHPPLLIQWGDYPPNSPSQIKKRMCLPHFGGITHCGAVHIAVADTFFQVFALSYPVLIFILITSTNLYVEKMVRGDQISIEWLYPTLLLVELVPYRMATFRYLAIHAHNNRNDYRVETPSVTRKSIRYIAFPTCEIICTPTWAINAV